tara:strand:- start:181 stop:495 length:315 start_codon:yes stop_codon:yes gene_type:complete
MKANKEKRINMYQLEKNLIDELNDNKEEILKNEDLLHEYVYSHIPVYNYDRLLLACDDLWLGYPSESGISEGCDNAYDIIAHNVYEKLMEVAHSWLNDNQREVA